MECSLCKIEYIAKAEIPCGISSCCHYENLQIKTHDTFQLHRLSHELNLQKIK